MKGWLVVQRGMLESVETVFRKITRTGARCRSLKVARDLTSVGLVHHRAWSLRSTVRGRRPIILARGILHKISPFFYPRWCFHPDGDGEGGRFSPKPVHKYYRVAFYSAFAWERSRGQTLVNIFRKHSSIFVWRDRWVVWRDASNGR